MSEMPAIEIIDLYKTYKGAEEPALNGISLKVPIGEIFGLLGPNGAGKTTTINILCSIISQSKGQVNIDGMSLRSHPEAIKRIIGVVPQDIALYPTLTARENLSFIGSMYGLKGKALRKKIRESLEIFGLGKFADRAVQTYSGGMKRRLNLVAGIMHQPKILFLDEPTVGIDVHSRTVILEFLKNLNRDGTTIIYTSHYLEEAEQLCSLIAIIDMGKIIIQGRPAELIKIYPEAGNLETLFLHLTGRKLRDH